MAAAIEEQGVRERVKGLRLVGLPAVPKQRRQHAAKEKEPSLHQL